MKAKVTYTDGRQVEVVAGPRAQVETERRYDLTLVEALKGGRLEHIYFLAWAGLHFANQESSEYDDWLSLIVDVDIIAIDAGDEPDPTRPARGRKASSR